ncbi:hypothetical protein [Pseudobutyrivibrio sp. MD2005]|nr:hypothetical protein [Pseudobutyrivibrio sp. MD2005]
MAKRRGKRSWGLPLQGGRRQKEEVKRAVNYHCKERGGKKKR